MPEFDFILKFKLPENVLEPEMYLDRLYECNCDDAVVGIGKPNYIYLNFIRESTSASLAVESAIKNVRLAIPQAVLVSISPDLVGVTDIANLLKCSRQNIRKLLDNNTHCPSPPSPIYEGAQSIWHLAEILTWLREHKAYSIDCSLLETAKIAMNINISRQYETLALS